MDDCLIIGAGVIGLSLAYELSGSGRRVHVLERGAEPGREASWAGAGILPAPRRGAGGTATEQLAALSCRLHAEWAARLKTETGIDTEFTTCGEIHLARSAAAAQVLRHEADAWRAGDLAIEEWTPDELLRRERALASPNARVGSVGILDGITNPHPQAPILAAYRLPAAAQVRNPRHLKALVAACRQRGVRLTTRAAVEKLAARGGRVDEVVTTAGRFRAERVVLCAGAWTAELLDQLGCPAPLKPIRGQMVLLRLAGRAFESIFHEGPHYLVPRRDGRVLVGSTIEDVGFDKRTTADAIAELLQFAGSLVPALADAEVERCWAGLRPGNLLADPLIGPLPGCDNVLVAAGHFRWGLYLSTGTAKLLGQMIRGESPVIDPAYFRPGR